MNQSSQDASQRHRLCRMTLRHFTMLLLFTMVHFTPPHNITHHTQVITIAPYNESHGYVSPYIAAHFTKPKIKSPNPQRSSLHPIFFPSLYVVFAASRPVDPRLVKSNSVQLFRMSLPQNTASTSHECPPGFTFDFKSHRSTWIRIICCCPPPQKCHSPALSQSVRI